MSGQKFIRTPFATTGDKTAIPDAVQVDGSLSWAEGFGFDYERNPASDPAAKRIPRDQTNQYLFDLSNNIREYQIAGFPEWVTAAQNGGVALAYPINAYVRWNGGAGTDWLVYVSLVDGATLEPGVAVGWEAEWQVSAPVDPATLKATQTQTNEGTGTGLVGAVELVKAARENRWTYAGVGAWTAGEIAVAFSGAAPFVQGAGAAVQFSVPAPNPAGAITLKVGANVALPLKNYDGSDLAAGDLIAGVVYYANVNVGATQWRLQTMTVTALAKYASAGDGSIFGYMATNTIGSLNTHITFSAGNCRDSTNQRSIPRTAPMTKALNAVWAAGNGNGGRDQVGAPAANETWHAFAILNDTTQVTDLLYSKSVAAPTLPGGYTYFRRVFSFILDASANIRQFFHYGDYVALKVRGVEWSATLNSVAAGTLRDIGVPKGLKLWVRFYYTSTAVGGSGANPAFTGIFDPDVGVPTFGTPTQWATIRVAWASGTTDRYQERLTYEWCNTNAQVYTASNDTGDTIAGGVLGWWDYRGRWG